MNPVTGWGDWPPGTVWAISLHWLGQLHAISLQIGMAPLLCPVPQTTSEYMYIRIYLPNHIYILT